MHDENNNLAQANQLTESLERLWGGHRPSKKAKSIAARVPCGELAQAQALEKSTLLNSSCPIYVRTCNGVPPASISKLPSEITHQILNFLPLSDVGRLGQTSTYLNGIVCGWLETNRIQTRIAFLLAKAGFLTTESQWSGRLTLPHDVHKECKRIGALLKKVTCLTPTSLRLAFYCRFIQKLKEVVAQKVPHIKPHFASSINGVILHALIAGWDKRECRTVFHSLNNYYNIPADVSCYLEQFNGDIDEKLYTIRIHIRSLFLDFCTWQDRSLWLHLVFDEFKLNTPCMVASMLLLLYAPLGLNGGSPWSLIMQEDAAMGVGYYKVLGESLVKLTAGTFSHGMSFVELFDTITGSPDGWSFRAQACLLLSAFFHDKKSVVPYFRQLAADKCNEMVVALVAEVIAVANDFLTLTVWTDCLEPVTNRSVLHLILSAINAGWGHEERRCIVNEVWKDVRDLANELLDDAFVLGCTEDLADLLETWKNIAINVKY